MRDGALPIRVLALTGTAQKAGSERADRKKRHRSEAQRTMGHRALFFFFFKSNANLEVNFARSRRQQVDQLRARGASSRFQLSDTRMLHTGD